MTTRQLMNEKRDEQLRRERELAVAIALLYHRPEAMILAFLDAHPAIANDLPANEHQWTTRQREAIAALLALIGHELTRVAPMASSSVYESKRTAVDAGSAHALSLIRAMGYTGLWVALSDNTLATISHRTRGIGGFVNRYTVLAQTTTSRIHDVLTLPVISPAKLSPSRFKTALTDSITHTTRNDVISIARSESWQSYGDGLVESYHANPDAVTGWLYNAVLDRKTCVCCVCLDGTEHTLEEVFSPLHDSCRCFATPIVAGDNPYTPQDARAWFNTLSVADKQAMLGMGAYRLYRDGIVTLDDLVTATTTNGETFYRLTSMKVLRAIGKITPAQYTDALKRT
jgi:hypothetical protein